jgi:hypothetical protein
MARYAEYFRDLYDLLRRPPGPVSIVPGGPWTEGAPVLDVPYDRCRMGWFEETGTGCRYPLLVDLKGHAWNVGLGCRVLGPTIARHFVVPDPYAPEP